MRSPKRKDPEMTLLEKLQEALEQYALENMSTEDTHDETILDDMTYQAEETAKDYIGEITSELQIPFLVAKLVSDGAWCP